MPQLRKEGEEAWSAGQRQFLCDSLKASELVQQYADATHDPDASVWLLNRTSVVGEILNQLERREAGARRPREERGPPARGRSPASAA